MSLGRVLTIAEIAQRAGWHGREGRRRMWRHLRRVNAELGGLLLTNIARAGGRPRWAVAEGSLRRVHPDWFDEDAGRIEELEARVRELEQRGAPDGGDLEARVLVLEQVTEAHTEKLARMGRR